MFPKTITCLMAEIWHSSQVNEPGQQKSCSQGWEFVRVRALIYGTDMATPTKETTFDPSFARRYPHRSGFVKYWHSLDFALRGHIFPLYASLTTLEFVFFSSFFLPQNRLFPATKAEFLIFWQAHPGETPKSYASEPMSKHALASG